LQKDNLVAVISFHTGDSPSINCDMVLKANDLMGDIENYPVEENASEVTHEALELHEGEGKVVFVMPKDPIEILIAIIFIENRVI
jgi:hypothetical protein